MRSNSIYFILCLKIISVICVNEYCLNEENKNCNKKENIYAREVNEKYADIIQNIDNALNSYKPCHSNNCSCYSSVINKDLKPYKQNKISKQIIDSIRTKGTKYQIINGQLYRDKDCMFPSRCDGIEYFILKLVSKLPDLEMIVNTRDWPQVHKNYGPQGPVFSFSKTNDYKDVMYPTWSFWEGGPAISLYPRGLGRWDSHRISLSKAGNETPWEEKENKGFFRGSRTSSERDNLVLLSRDYPDLVDAQYTKNQAWKSDADTLHAPPANEVSLEDHCKYKYLFNFRGVAASFRFKHLFLCKSLVYHVGNEWIEFFYPILKPWVHYIPVDTKASKKDIKKLIEFAKDNDELVEKIASRGYQTIWNHLKMDDIVCYWNKLLRRYAKLLDYTPELDPNLKQIKKKLK